MDIWDPAKRNIDIPLLLPLMNMVLHHVLVYLCMAGIRGIMPKDIHDLSTARRLRLVERGSRGFVRRWKLDCDRDGPQ